MSLPPTLVWVHYEDDGNGRDVGLSLGQRPDCNEVSPDHLYCGWAALIRLASRPEDWPHE